MLELRTHEAISLSRTPKQRKVDGEHRHVKDDWYRNKAYRPGREVLDENARWLTGIAEYVPQLYDGAYTNRGYGE
jgi:hypothetical protein